MKHEFSALLINPETMSVELIKIKTDFLYGRRDLSDLISDNSFYAIQVDARTIIIFQKNYDISCTTITSWRNSSEMNRSLTFMGKLLVIGGNIEASEFYNVTITEKEMRSGTIFSHIQDNNPSINNHDCLF